MYNFNGVPLLFVIISSGYYLVMFMVENLLSPHYAYVFNLILFGGLGKLT